MMNSSPATFAKNDAETAQPRHSYFDWVNRHFPLLSAENLEEQYGRQMLTQMAASQKEPIPPGVDSRVVIFVDSKNQIYKDLRKQAFEQFAQLCAAANERDEFAAECRHFLSYLVISDGYPAYSEQCHSLAEQGAMHIRELMKEEEFRPDLHSAVSGIIANSMNARLQVRTLMLDAFEEYFEPDTKVRPWRRELSGTLFAGLTLELQRPKADQNADFQARLAQLLMRHPHPQTNVVLAVIAAEHNDEALRRRSREWLKQLQDSLTHRWENTTVDQVSSVSYRAQTLHELLDADSNLHEDDCAQAIFNACKGMKITKLSDERLSQLHKLLQHPSTKVRLASAVALSNIYALDPACEVASEAIGLLTDWSINGEEGRFIIDALNAVKNFESMSDACAKKVENAYIAANQKFIFRSAMNKTD